MRLISPDHALSIRRQCAVLGLHRSMVYYCPETDYEDSRMMNLISEIHKDYPYYGYRKIHHVLSKEGVAINKKRVLRLMRLMGIKPLYPGIKTSLPGRDGSVYPYLLSGLPIIRPNQVWAVDITYIKLPVGMVYLFALIDWYSRFIVSYVLANTMEASHAVEALESALRKDGVPEICNADQGCQFTGLEWINKLLGHGIRISHDGVGRCIDNVRIERFLRTIKYEDIFLHAYSNMTEASTGIERFIKHYNYNRPHQALLYKTPYEIYCSNPVTAIGSPACTAL